MILTSIEVERAAACTRSDAELLRDICADKADALDSLFHRYVRLVSGIAHRILNDRAEAEDITQEVFLEIYRKAHLIQRSGDPFASGCCSTSIIGRSVARRLFDAARRTGENRSKRSTSGLPIVCLGSRRTSAAGSCAPASPSCRRGSVRRWS